MVSELIGEILMISLMIVAAAALMLSMAPKPPQPVCQIVVKDAYPPASTGELFDVIMLSGEIPYGNLKVVLLNATSGNQIDLATFNGTYLRGKVIFAHVNDTDGRFSTGDDLRFCGSLSPGIYEVIVVNGRFVAFDGRVDIK